MAGAKSAEVRLYLDCGTLLGYVREQHILPCDDGIDLFMIGKQEVASCRYVKGRFVPIARGGNCGSMAAGVAFGDKAVRLRTGSFVLSIR